MQFKLTVNLDTPEFAPHGSNARDPYGGLEGPRVNGNMIAAYLEKVKGSLMGWNLTKGCDDFLMDDKGKRIAQWEIVD